MICHWPPTNENVLFSVYGCSISTNHWIYLHRNYWQTMVLSVGLHPYFFQIGLLTFSFIMRVIEYLENVDTYKLYLCNVECKLHLYLQLLRLILEKIFIRIKVII